LKGDKHEATKIAACPDGVHVAVGYNDGKICVFNMNNGEVIITFNGHKSAVTALAYDHDGLRLVSGGKVSDCFLSCIIILLATVLYFLIVNFNC